MDDLTKRLHVRLHSPTADGHCMADVVLPQSGNTITGFKVMGAAAGGVHVYMPSWMHNRWSYPEISWPEVRQVITDHYAAHPPVRPRKPAPSASSAASFHFYSAQHCTEHHVQALIPDAQLHAGDLMIIHDQAGPVWVRYTKGRWTDDRIDWEELRTTLIDSFRHQILQDPETPDPGAQISCLRQEEVFYCMADATLPGKRNAVKGFRIRQGTDGHVRISPPVWMQDRWSDPDLSWYQLTQLIRDAYLKQRPTLFPGTATQTPPLTAPDDTEGNTLPKRADQPPKERNELGRALNADGAPFRYVPQTVLRPDERSLNAQEMSKKQVIGKLVGALSKGTIGPTEIKIVSWVDQLRFLKTSMLADLFRGGYITKGRREKVTMKKISELTRRLNSYDLLSLSRFVCVDDDGLCANTSRSNYLILTMGNTGADMLRDMGISANGFRPFDTFQDGNTVKKYLAANQWMIYWMTHFPDQVGDDHVPARVVYQRGADMQGARMYATVTCSDLTMIAEPVRRVDPAEEKRTRMDLREKFGRLVQMLAHHEDLYCGREELQFSERPVLVYVCEDDDHILQLWELLRDLIEEAPDQELWFTTDLRVFNENMLGQRFLKVVDGQFQIIDLASRFGIEERPEAPQN